jgi:hypothetical protein
MVKKIIDKIDEPQINKYIIKLDDGAIMLVHGKDKVSAITILSKVFRDNSLEKFNFSMDKVEAEIKEDGTVIKYIGETEVK